jgi:DNA polymerase-4
LLNALYVDFNSYFASVEQQERPRLRGKPVGVLPVMAETTCCIAASYEAKAFGVKTGTNVREARKLCPEIVFIEARPELYIRYHHELVDIVESCTHVERTLSIDEMVCMLTGSQQKRENALALADRIKQAIATRKGAYIRCSIGIGPNVFLAKLASNMKKPDGCVVIEQHELPDRLYPLELRALNGIGRRMEQRLIKQGITSVRQLCHLDRQQLRSAWGSIEGERMYEKLRGIEPNRRQNDRKSLGHSHVLSPDMRNRDAALSVLHRLLQKACLRMRSYGLQTATVQLRVKILNQDSWGIEGKCAPTDDTLTLINILEQLWQHFPRHGHEPYAVGISFSSLIRSDEYAEQLFQPEPSSRLNGIVDKLNMRYGKNTVYFGGAHNALSHAPMRIAFNHIPDLDIENDAISDQELP